jgi:hypothetical protein
MSKERYKCEFENECDGEACDICLQSLIDSITEENKQLKESLKIAVDALEKYVGIADRLFPQSKFIGCDTAQEALKKIDLNSSNQLQIKLNDKQEGK